MSTKEEILAAADALEEKVQDGIQAFANTSPRPLEGQTDEEFEQVYETYLARKRQIRAIQGELREILHPLRRLLEDDE